MDNRNETMITKLEEMISNLESKNFKMYFFVIDTKGNPHGGVEYMYDIALEMHNNGYDVTMLHQEQEFVGPFDWLGERYSVLPHENVEASNVPISATDFLFIPEVYSNVMIQTKELPCRRVVVCRNPEFMLEFIPVGASWFDFGIYDVIVPNAQVENKIKRYFPNIRTYIIRPSVKNAFHTTDEPKKLIVNLLAKDRGRINDILKPFYWKYPAYKWVSFRDMGSPMTAELYPNVLREAAITVWVDDDTTNGISAYEAVKSGNMLIAKMPRVVPEWMTENNELRNDIIWFDDFDSLHDILASVIRGWTRNDIKEEFTTVGEKLTGVFSPETQKIDIEKTIVDGIIRNRLNEYRQFIGGMKNNTENNE